MGARTRYGWAIAAVLAAGLSTGCDPFETPEDDEGIRLRDARAASHGSSSLDGPPAFVHVGNLFAFDVNGNADLSDEESVRQWSLESVYNRLSFTFAVIGCDSDLSEDGQAVSLTMQGCRLLLWEIDADVQATASVESSACEAGTCPEAVVWSLDISELSMGLIGLRKGGIEGPMEIRAPLDPAERMSWQTYPGFVLETRQGIRFDTLSNASWAVGDDNCVDLDFGARLALEEREDELDELVGDLVLSARDLRRCPGKCTASGEVQLSFGAGQVIAWSHDGSASLQVRGPRGREVEVELSCTPDSSS